MKRFVEQPNLPHCAEVLSVGEKYRDILSKPLEKLGLIPLFVPDNPFVDRRLCAHADLSVFHAGKDRVILAPFLRGSQFADRLGAFGFSYSFAPIEQKSKYPSDAQLNACVVGKHLLCSLGITADEIIHYMTAERGAEIVSVRQGYVKCSVCVVNKNTIITSDRVIADQSRERGMDVLEIAPGCISLDGFSYGFIGGSSFKISDKQLAFTGVLDDHPDKNRIFDFLERHNIEPVFLTDRQIFDIGSAVPLTEKS